jgi:hypothetical protein
MYAEILRKRPKVITDKLFIYLYKNILKIDKLTPKKMKTYNESVMELDKFSLFTDYAKAKRLSGTWTVGKHSGV